MYPYPLRWGSIGKVFDFPTLAAYKKYQDCADISLERAFTLPFAVAKALNLQRISFYSMGNLNSAAFVRISASNVSTANMSAIMSLHRKLFSAITGMSSGTSVCCIC